MQSSSIVMHGIDPKELKKMIGDLIKDEFNEINIEMQRVIGEDDLVSTGTCM